MLNLTLFLAVVASAVYLGVRIGRASERARRRLDWTLADFDRRVAICDEAEDSWTR